MIAYLQHLTKNALDTETLKQVQQHIVTKTYKNKEIIGTTDILSRNLYFIESGLTRVFYSTEIKDVTFYFMKEKDFYISVESIYQNSTSRCGIEAIGETVVSRIDFDFINRLLGKTPEFASMKESLFVDYIIKTNERLHFAKFTTPKERLGHIMATQPELFNQVSVSYIASYLGMSRETLSRLRGEIST
ncbi:Crp/Fnr family transcriptional regulator [Marinilongibacter aquaticus]|uniref:Crp/Fnr family transcriptional regulator n=1 Tax=Marinilongibacter aquaticus TaxID=2975157 RepID=UPI0021BD5E32|nr:Crp/Fnr family transcriptional regulator [Marinilongibacter aquaticus]UBM60802.1 Crp/Fnr family transcriptional regulator [Marinilongibacter aquaticus]